MRILLIMLCFTEETAPKREFRVGEVGLTGKGADGDDQANMSGAVLCIHGIIRARIRSGQG